MGKISACLLVCLAANVTASQAQNHQSIVPADVSLAHFAQIDQGVYVGSKPRTNQDFQFLQSRHVRYIVNVRFLPLLSGSEKKKAKQYGMTLLTFPMNASPIPPSQKHVNQILFTLHDRQFEPVYVHCVLGRDRTSLISGLYKIYFLSIPKREAWQEMKESAFHTWWFVRGLTVYFDKHSGGPSS